MSDEIAYRELKAGEVIQASDEWQTESGRWVLFHQAMIGQPLRDGHCRRSYNITQLVKEQREASEAIMIWQRSLHDLVEKNQHLTAELTRLQQAPPATDHIVDADKMVETELERKAWELFCHSADRSTHDSFDDATRFLAERNRRRQAGMATTDVVGD